MLACEVHLLTLWSDQGDAAAMRLPTACTTRRRTVIAVQLEQHAPLIASSLRLPADANASSTRNRGARPATPSVPRDTRPVSRDCAGRPHAAAHARHDLPALMRDLKGSVFAFASWPRHHVPRSLPHAQRRDQRFRDRPRRRDRPVSRVYWDCHCTWLTAANGRRPRRRLDAPRSQPRIAIGAGDLGQSRL
jgi:hypothetical protein